MVIHAPPPPCYENIASEAVAGAPTYEDGLILANISVTSLSSPLYTCSPTWYSCSGLKSIHRLGYNAGPNKHFGRRLITELGLTRAVDYLNGPISRRWSTEMASRGSVPLEQRLWLLILGS